MIDTKNTFKSIIDSTFKCSIPSAIKHQNVTIVLTDTVDNLNDLYNETRENINTSNLLESKENLIIELNDDIDNKTINLNELVDKKTSSMNTKQRKFQFVEQELKYTTKINTILLSSYIFCLLFACWLFFKNKKYKNKKNIFIMFMLFIFPMFINNIYLLLLKLLSLLHYESYHYPIYNI
jgi:hypothetical protein